MNFRLRPGAIMLFFLLGLSLVPAAVAPATEEIPASDADVILIGAQADLIGASIGVGDFNGDQNPDLFAGAPGT